MDEDISDVDYSRLVGILGERNRPSGGIKTVHEVIIQGRINNGSKILEIGSNTGFTSVQIARLAGAQVSGIDINADSIKAAVAYAAQHGVSDRVDFSVASATQLPFPDQSFDLVWASNVTSFLADKQAAISEYMRVLRNDGYLAFIPIYYVGHPPKHIVEQVSKAIGTKVSILSKQDWIDMIVNEATDASIELVYENDMRYVDRGEAIDAYISIQMDKMRGRISDQQFKQLQQRYESQIRLFNENLSYAAYSVMLFQKNKVKEEPELFLTRKL